MNKDGMPERRMLAFASNGVIMTTKKILKMA